MHILGPRYKHQLYKCTLLNSKSNKQIEIIHTITLSFKMTNPVIMFSSSCSIVHQVISVQIKTVWKIKVHLMRSRHRCQLCKCILLNSKSNKQIEIIHTITLSFKMTNSCYYVFQQLLNGTSSHIRSGMT